MKRDYGNIISINDLQMTAGLLGIIKSAGHYNFASQRCTEESDLGWSMIK